MTTDFYKGNVPWLVERTIFCTVHGSRAYGTNTPASDTDMKGVCIPPREYFLGFDKNFEQAEASEPIDLVVYGIHKFMKLAADCNPNIIEVLFTDPEHWVQVTPVGEKLYARRHEFLSLKAKHTFSGYAISQLKRMKSHRSWLLNPPAKMPDRNDYGLENTKKISASVLGAYNSLEESGAAMNSEVMELFGRERSYQTALTHYKQYMNWKKKRNAARFETELKFGYDTKHAMHLVRLMRMCREIITVGEVVVKRPDAEELLSIRNGAWTYDHLIEWAERQDSELEVLYKAECKKTTPVLPKSSNKVALSELSVELVEMMI